MLALEPLQLTEGGSRSQVLSTAMNTLLHCASFCFERGIEVTREEMLSTGE